MTGTLEASRLVRKAKEIRIIEHRLKPSLRLRSRQEIVNFIHEKGLVSGLGGNELPGLISAVLGKEWKPSAKGFKGWLDWWSLTISGDRIARISGEIERRNDIIGTRVFRGNKTFVSNKVWPIIHAILTRFEELSARKEAFSPLELKLLETIESSEPIRTAELRRNLRIETKENSKFHRSLAHLEGFGLIVGAEDPAPERHMHANIWQSWNRRTHAARGKLRLSYEGAVAELVEKTIDASVFVRETEIREWFKWDADYEAIAEELVQSTRLVRAGSYLIAPRVATRR